MISDTDLQMAPHTCREALCPYLHDVRLSSFVETQTQATETDSQDFIDLVRVLMNQNNPPRKD